MQIKNPLKGSIIFGKEKKEKKTLLRKTAGNRKLLCFHPACFDTTASPHHKKATRLMSAASHCRHMGGWVMLHGLNNAVLTSCRAKALGTASPIAAHPKLQAVPLLFHFTSPGCAVPSCAPTCSCSTAPCCPPARPTPTLLSAAQGRKTQRELFQTCSVHGQESSTLLFFPGS